jgi:hypothetical protein
LSGFEGEWMKPFDDKVKLEEFIKINFSKVELTDKSCSLYLRIQKETIKSFYILPNTLPEKLN